jgi:hypothetical protein
VDTAARPAVGTITTRTTNPTGGTGDWNTNNYGQYGHILAAYDNTTSDRAVLPADVRYTTSGTNLVQWATNTTDTSHLADPARSTRTLGGWWSGSTMTQTLRFAEPAARTLRIYVHAAGATRNQTVSVTVGATTQTQIISNLTGVLWLDVPINVPAGGTATITTTSVVNNAVINGLFLDPPATNTCSITTGLTPGTPYTASVTATNSAGTGPSAISTGGWSPASVSPALWLDANDPATITASGGAVSTWADKSGNASDATQATSAQRPAYSATSFSGRPGITFDGSNDSLPTLTNVMRNTTHGVYWAWQRVGAGTGDAYRPSIAGHPTTAGADRGALHYVKTNNLGASYPYFQAPVNVNYDLGSGTAYADNVGYVQSFQSNTTGWGVWRDGALEGTTNGIGTPDASINGYILGAQYNPARYSNIVMSEVVMVESTDTTTRQRIEGYLAWKWGLQTSLPAGHPYRNAAPTV